MLDDRKAAILYAVVQEYINTARPVGSSRVAKARGVRVSPATVRAEMSALEDGDFLVQPHTSAGRVPTVKAYRFFVDYWADRTPRLTAPDRRQVNEFFASDHGEFESILADTTGLLSDLTQWTAVVVGPTSSAAIVRSAQLIDIGSHNVLVVAVMSNGAVEKRTLSLRRSVTPSIVEAASEQLARRVIGRTLAEVEDCDHNNDALLSAALQALREAQAQHEVFIAGTARLASAFDGIERLGEVLKLLEQQVAMVQLMRTVLDQGNRVAIGKETGVESLSDCALVLAPYRAAGSGGTIGVLGPTRMDYPQALSAVAAVSVRLGSALSEG